MKTIKTFFYNAWIATVYWGVLHVLFSIISAVVILSIGGGFAALTNENFKIILSTFIIVFLAIIGALVLLFYLGKNIKYMKNGWITFLSIFPLHVVILLVLRCGESYFGGHIEILLINWFGQLMNSFAGLFFRLTAFDYQMSDLCEDFFGNAVLTLVPYCVLFAGCCFSHHRRKCQENTENGAARD